MIKIVGGYKQPIAKLPGNEEKVGHPCPSEAKNKRLKNEMRNLLNSKKKK